MFARVLAVTVACFSIGAVLMLLQRRGAVPRRPTSWRKYGVYVLFVVGMLALARIGAILYALSMLGILAMALLEFRHVVGLRGRAAVGLVGAGLTVALVALLAGSSSLYAVVVMWALVMIAAAALSHDPRGDMWHTAWSVTGFIAIGASGAHLLLLAQHPDRFPCFAFLFLVVCGGDAFAELVGRRWPMGRGFIQASPNKTLSGVAGGVVAALIIGLAVNAAVGFRVAGIAAVIALAVTIAGVMGDLVASGLKRTFGVKDFATALPGHGGVLDRVDSLLFAAPPFYWLIRG